MAEYFRHWLNMGKRMNKPPRIFHANWFRTDNQGEFIWSGFRENLRILEWILDRCNNKVEAQTTAIGFIPKAADIDMTGLELPKGAMDKLLSVEKRDWQEELKGIKEFFRQFKKDLPDELWQEYHNLQKRLNSHE